MRRLLFLTVALLLLPAMALAQQPRYQVTLKSGGAIYKSSGEIIPMYGLDVGDPSPNVALTTDYIPLYGLYAIDAKIYVRFPEDHSLWYSVFFHRPKSIIQHLRFVFELETNDGPLDMSFAEKSEPGEATAILPPPFDHLNTEDVALVKSLLVYTDGTMHLMFADGATLAETEAFLGRVDEYYPLDISIAPDVAS
jgi:hypothetical protein